MSKQAAFLSRFILGSCCAEDMDEEKAADIFSDSICGSFDVEDERISELFKIWFVSNVLENNDWQETTKELIEFASKVGLKIRVEYK